MQKYMLYQFNKMVGIVVIPLPMLSFLGQKVSKWFSVEGHVFVSLLPEEGDVET